MSTVRVAIGRMKRDISKLVNRVAYGGERIILTSRGKPKAVLISLADYERLQQEQKDKHLAHWQAWMAESERLNAQIMAHRQGEPLDLDALWEAARADLEARDERAVGH